MGKLYKVGMSWEERKHGCGEMIPIIRLRGQWLRQFGFDVATEFELIYDFDGALILKRKQ